jgi:hypothetical protein
VLVESLEPVRVVPVRATPPFVITDFKDLYRNLLGLGQSDDRSLLTYALAPNGATFRSNAGSYWYTEVGNATHCFATTANYVRITGTGLIANKVSLFVAIEYSDVEVGCQNSFRLGQFVDRWTLDPATGFEVGELRIPLDNLNDKNKIFGVNIDAPITPFNQDFVLTSISFADTSFSSSDNLVTTIRSVPTFGTCKFQAECANDQDTCVMVY